MTKLQTITLQTETITYSKTHLIINDEISFEEWGKAVETFARLGETWQWWLGDLLKFGEGKWGEMYAQALDSTEMSYGALRDLTWVSNVFTPERRREGLSWSIHREVAQVENQKKQDQLLRLCEKKEFSVRKLRKHLAEETQGLLGEAKKEEKTDEDICRGAPTNSTNGGEGEEQFSFLSENGEDSDPIPPDAVPEVPKIDLTDGTTKRNYEKMLKELDNFLRLRVPNMFLKGTVIEDAVVELREMLLEAGR